MTSIIPAATVLSEELWKDELIKNPTNIRVAGGTIATAYHPSSQLYLRKLPEIPVWLMMKYFSIKNKDLTGILTNFKNSELAIKLN